MSVKKFLYSAAENAFNSSIFCCVRFSARAFPFEQMTDESSCILGPNGENGSLLGSHNGSGSTLLEPYKVSGSLLDHGSGRQLGHHHGTGSHLGHHQGTRR